MKRKAELVFVTGAGSGIGRATCRRFARMGATAIATDIDLATAEETAELIRAEGGSAFAYHLDVRDVDAWEKLAEEIRGTHGVPDVVVNNAGMFLGGHFLEHTTEDWESQLGIHLMGCVHGSRLFGKQMVERGHGGHIVNVSSVAAFGGFPLSPTYSVGKAAVKMLSECLHAELAKYDIGCSAMCFGLISTNIISHGEMLNATADQEKAFDVAKSIGQAGMPILGADPDAAAKAIVSAVRHNTAVRPVRPEAWLMWYGSRLSPGAARLIMRFARREYVEQAADLVPWDVVARFQPIVARLPGMARH